MIRIGGSVVLVVGLLIAQDRGPVFDVASVKPGRGQPIQVRSDPGRLTIDSVALDVLIKMAYGLRDYQFVGPSWLHTDRYDIVATTSTPQSRSAQLMMLRALLTERFQLAIHHETKTMAVYALVVGKNGSKLKAMDENLSAPFEMYSNFSIGTGPGGGSELRGFGSLGQFSDFLSRVAEKPVVDRTGLTGNFDLRLFCAIDGFPGFETSPSVFDALQSQMGLKLEAATTAVEITVVDKVEKPTGN
jgi:uncharacterized protein (TIGR03435 family)